jgi:hypothetical protein
MDHSGRDDISRDESTVPLPRRQPRVDDIPPLPDRTAVAGEPPGDGDLFELDTREPDLAAILRGDGDRPGPGAGESGWPGSVGATRLMPVVADGARQNGRLAVLWASTRSRTVVAIALAVLATAILVPLIWLAPGAARVARDTGPAGQPSNPVHPGSAAAGPGTGVSATSSGGGDSGADNPAPPASPGAGGGVGRSPSSAPASAPPPSGHTASLPLVIEAETATNTLSGTARVSPYDGASGGELVAGIGKLDNSPPGSLQFNGVTVASAGDYVLTFYYVVNTTRTAIVSVNGQPGLPVSVSKQSSCCGGQRLSITLTTGVNTITFSNSDARCPSIDRIVIDKA